MRSKISKAFIIKSASTITMEKHIAICTLFIAFATQAVTGSDALVKPGTGVGKIAFINTQSRLNETNITKVIHTLNPSDEYDMRYEKASPGDPTALKTASGAALAIIIVDDPSKPTTLVAVDDGWAIVNVASLDRSLKTERAKRKFFEGRCRRQLMRVYSFVAGGASSMYNGNICDPIPIEKLDLFAEALPFDVIVKNEKYLEAIGVTKRVYMSYEDACEEGWAPKPTNDVQKVIWDKVHALPKNPITIKPETKKVAR